MKTNPKRKNLTHLELALPRKVHTGPGIADNRPKLLFAFKTLHENTLIYHRPIESTAVEGNGTVELSLIPDGPV
jgi:hypothetical protein